MKRLWLSAFFLLILAAGAIAEDKAGYIKLLNSGKMEELKAYLDSWQVKEPQNPELFIGFFNYYVNLARRENVVFGGQNPPKKGEYLTITDSSSGKEVGYMYGEVYYLPEYSQKALSIINEGIALSPDRLDMHFGKTRLLAELHAYEAQKDYILVVLDRARENRSVWYWSDGKAFADGEEGFIQAIHDYLSEWFSEADEKKLAYARDVSARLVEQYPTSVIACNDSAIAYARLGDLENAEKAFLRAYALDGNDYIVISNLAYINEVKGNKEKAIGYYELMLKSGNKQIVDRATKRLVELRR